MLLICRARVLWGQMAPEELMQEPPLVATVLEMTRDTSGTTGMAMGTRATEITTLVMATVSLITTMAIPTSMESQLVVDSSRALPDTTSTLRAASVSHVVSYLNHPLVLHHLLVQFLGLLRLPLPLLLPAHPSHDVTWQQSAVSGSRA